MRASDTVARVGGDEFVLLLPSIDHAQDALTVAYKVQEQLATPMHIEGHEFNIACSTGVAIFPDHGQDADALMSHADTAMYQAKHTGEGQVLLYAPHMAPTSPAPQAAQVTAPL
jgi:diguanylate cyclase (GGDEF)-like protein